MLNSKEIGNVIKKRRIMLGFSQDDLAKKLDVTRSTISYYENGHRTIDALILQKIAIILNTTPDYILGFKESHNKEKEKEILKSHFFSILEQI